MVIALPIAFQCNIYRLCTVDQNIIHSIKQIDALWYSATATKTHTKCETSKHDSFSIRRFIRSFVTTVRLKCHPLETVANSKSTIILLSTLTPIINCFNLFIFCVSLFYFIYFEWDFDGITKLSAVLFLLHAIHSRSLAPVFNGNLNWTHSFSRCFGWINGPKYIREWNQSDKFPVTLKFSLAQSQILCDVFFRMGFMR